MSGLDGLLSAGLGYVSGQGLQAEQELRSQAELMKQQTLERFRRNLDQQYAASDDARAVNLYQKKSDIDAGQARNMPYALSPGQTRYDPVGGTQKTNPALMVGGGRSGGGAPNNTALINAEVNISKAEYEKLQEVDARFEGIDLSLDENKALKAQKQEQINTVTTYFDGVRKRAGIGNGGGSGGGSNVYGGGPWRLPEIKRSASGETVNPGQGGAPTPTGSASSLSPIQPVHAAPSNAPPPGLTLQATNPAGVQGPSGGLLGESRAAPSVPAQMQPQSTAPDPSKFDKSGFYRAPDGQLWVLRNGKPELYNQFSQQR